jgi:H+/Cl- antiporter ClcA
MESQDERGEGNPAPALHQAPSRRWWKVLALWGALIGCQLGFVGLMIRLVQKVRAGHGGELYRSFWGYRLSYVGVLVVVVLSFVAVLVGAAIGWWQNRHERDFNRKYPDRPPGK